MKQPKKTWARTPKQQRRDQHYGPRIHPHIRSGKRQHLARLLWKAHRQHERQVISQNEDIWFRNPYRIKEHRLTWD